VKKILCIKLVNTEIDRLLEFYSDSEFPRKSFYASSWLNSEINVEFYSKNKFEKLVHLVGIIMIIYLDARPPEFKFVTVSPQYKLS